ncbi:uncharacterized protein LOC143344547 [Colletes latitarsis]|uniref:uncharacterized protein LOC143344547 n=1 Tax=Colletes latitarsis TaxID=2605962 RepID=UPI00403604C0
MHSNERTNGSSNHSTQDVDNVEELEEIKSTTLENSLDQYPLLLVLRDSVGGIEKLSTIGTQTPLTLIKLSVTQSSLGKQFIDTTSLPTRFDYKTTNDAIESSENMKSFPCTLLRNKTSVTFSREVTTQATPVHPSLIHSISRTPRNSMQIPTSFSSCKSEPKNEVLTVAIDYGSSSPDALSILTDAIDRNGNHSSSLDLASSNREISEDNVSTHGTHHRRWRLTNRLRCMFPVNNEVLNFV